MYLTLKTIPKHENTVTLEFTKWHYHALFASTLIGMCGFYLQMKNTAVRKETFARNYAILEQTLGKYHREAMGEDTHINKYGYPDIGNNIYSDLLPYKDWIKVNNA